MSHIRYDVIHPNEVRRSGLTAADKAQNAAVNDLGFSYEERTAAIDYIAGHYHMTPAQRDEISQKSDSYLAERQHLIRGYAVKEARAEEYFRHKEERSAHRQKLEAEVRGDAAGAEASWRKSVAGLNSRYDGQAAELPAQHDAPPTPARSPSTRGNAAAAEDAWRKGVAALNSRYDGQGDQPVARGDAHQVEPRRPASRSDAAAAEQAWHESVAHLNARHQA